MRHSLAREFKACWLIAVIVSPTALLAQPARVDHLGDPMPEGAITRLGSARLYHTGRDENRGMSIFSPDGIFLATVTPSGAKIWETRTGRKLGTIYLSATDSPVAAFSADSRSIAIAAGGQRLSPRRLACVPSQAVRDCLCRESRRHLRDRQPRTGEVPNLPCRRQPSGGACRRWDNAHDLESGEC